jgi:predicted sulfurtransferase
VTPRTRDAGTQNGAGKIVDGVVDGEVQFPALSGEPARHGEVSGGHDALVTRLPVFTRQQVSGDLFLEKPVVGHVGVEGLDPAGRPTPKLPARTLKQWLDEGRPVTLLDTRNDYEVRMGTFRGARPAGIDHFRDFPDAVARLPATLKNQPIVMFCTGGIRCEKAGPYMEREGFTNVHQLEGGILKYFEECGGAHYDGECFVFDRRVGVDPQLRETKTVMCFNCQMPLTPVEQQHPHYVADKTCPHCFHGKPQKISGFAPEL